MKRYLFFLRTHIDTDNIAPAAWFLLEDDPDAVADIVYYHFDFPYLNHPYIEALTARFGDRVRTAWIGDFLGLHYSQICDGEQITDTQWHTILAALRLEPNSYSRVFKNVPRAVADLAKAAAAISSGDTNIPQEAREAFISWVIAKGATPRLAIFDHQRGATLAGFVLALRKAGVERIVRLPVSPMVNVNVLREVKETYVRLDRAMLEAQLSFSGFDAIAFTDFYYPENVRRIFRELGWGDPLSNRLHVVGSIRYCPEWLAARPPPLAFRPPSHEDDRIKLVFFLSRRRTNTYWEEVERTICVLTQFPAFRIVVQPHPREDKAIDLAGTGIEILQDVPAPALVEWADVVMVWGSSIGIEALANDKTLLCLDYLTANRTIYEITGGGWLLRCRDDLVIALTKLQHDPRSRAYAKADADRLIREVVLAGGGESVPNRYLSFIREYEMRPSGSALA